MQTSTEDVAGEDAKAKAKAKEEEEVETKTEREIHLLPFFSFLFLPFSFL
jgi:hypothetical protein